MYYWPNVFSQEIIKVREWIPHKGLLSKVIPLKLFLDIVPSSSADITGALRGCFRGGFVSVVSFRFVSKQSKGKPPTPWGYILWYFDYKEGRQTSAKQTNAQTQARQPNKKMVECAGRLSLPKQQKQQRQQRQRQRRSKNNLIFNPRISRKFKFIQFVYTVRDIPKSGYVRQR